MEKRTIRVGSRESLLAVTQANMVISYIQEHCPQIGAELVTMKTTGDRILDRTLDQIGGKGLFVKELDAALLSKRSDLSVHSLKDLPMEILNDLPVLGFSAREDARDALVLPQGSTEIDFSKPIGCSSSRRILQLKEIYPQASFAPIRGNVQTRLRKLDAGEYSATVLAAAGLKRLGLESRISRYFTTDEMIPAAGQGVLAVQGRRGEDYRFLEGFFDRDSYYTSVCERAFVTELDGGCSSPIAAFAVIEKEQICLTGLYYDETTGKYRTGKMRGAVKEAEALGAALAGELKKMCGQGGNG